jgi:predicted nucleotidyltransferase
MARRTPVRAATGLRHAFYTGHMRLSRYDRDAICSATREIAGPLARPVLFGSRTRDSARGGDIDLLVELPEPSPEPFALADRLAARIQRRIGLRKIDVLVADPLTLETPVLKAARAEGVAL